MKLFGLLLLTAVLLVLGMYFYRLRAAPNAQPAFIAVAAATPATAPTRPVVIELFTSEGCSSCPPADALLQQLDHSSPVPGAELIVLSEHVDYWNYIGWTDPFSAPMFSARQQEYAQALERRGARGDVYTPQMIVDGQFEFVGSHLNLARAAIARALATPKARVQLTLAESPRPTELRLVLHISDLPPLAPTDRAEVLLAVTETNLASRVTRGENAGHKLPHTAVTRSLRVLTQFTEISKSFETTAVVPLVSAWKRPNLRVIAFVQEQVHRRILGAAALKLN